MNGSSTFSVAEGAASQIRNPKTEGRKKAEIRKPKSPALLPRREEGVRKRCGPGLRDSGLGFRLSFGLRFSAFGVGILRAN